MGAMKCVRGFPRFSFSTYGDGTGDPLWPLSCIRSLFLYVVSFYGSPVGTAKIDERGVPYLSSHLRSHYFLPHWIIAIVSYEY